MMTMRYEEGHRRWIMMFLRKSMKITEDILNEYYNDNKIFSYIILTVSQSIGNVGTVDSNMHDQYGI